MKALALLLLSRSARLARSAVGAALAGTFGVAILSRLALLVMAVILARDLGPRGYGIFVFATGVAALLAQLAAFGWPALTNRLMPAYQNQQDWSHLRGFLNAGDRVVGGLSVIASVVLVLLGLYTDLFSDDMSKGLLLSVLIVVPFALTRLRKQQLAAVGRPALGIFYDETLGPIIVVLVLLAAGLPDVTGAMAVYGAGSLLAVLLATLAFRRKWPSEIRAVQPAYLVATWMGMAMPIAVGLSSRMLMTKADVLMLAPLAGVEEVGLYGAAFRVTYVITFPQIVLMAVMTPLISQAFAAHRPDQLRSRLRIANLFSLLTALPPALLIIALSELIMEGVFGPAYAAAAPTLAILAVGQLAASLVMPFSSVLMMGGRERVFGTINLAALALNVLLNLLLAPRYGALGSAVATTISLSLILAMQWVASRRLLATFR